MGRLKDIYYGIVLYFCIDIVFGFLVNVYTIIISSTGADKLLIPLGSLFISLLTLYFFFVGLKSKRVIKWWLFLGLIILAFIPNTFYTYSWEEKHNLEQISLFSDIVEILYIVLLLFFSYKGYIKAVREKIFSLLFVYYGILIAAFSVIAVGFLKSVTFIIFKYISPDPVIVGFLSICIVACGIYFFFIIIKNIPAIRSYYLFIAVILLLATDKIYSLNIESFYSSADLSSVWVMVMQIGTLIIVTVKMVSYVRYYQLENKKSTEIPGINVKTALAVIFLIIINLAVSRISFFLQIDRENNKSYTETIGLYPPLAVDHFPDNITRVYSWSRPGDEMCDYFLLSQYGEKNMVHALNLLKKGYKAEYMASDTSLILVDKDFVRTNKDSMRLTDKRYHMIPNFEGFLDSYISDSISYHRSGLPSDFNIYIIDANIAGKKEENYSKGVCISKLRKIIIYWSTIW